MDTKQTTDLDSQCSRRVEAGDAAETRCKAEAVTWLVAPKGTRRYVCEDHAREVLRFLDADDPDDAALPEHPTVRVCSACGRYTLREDMNVAAAKCRGCLGGAGNAAE